jgi:hypothetical protein
MMEVTEEHVMKILRSKTRKKVRKNKALCRIRYKNVLMTQKMINIVYSLQKFFIKDCSGQGVSYTGMKCKRTEKKDVGTQSE